MEFYKPGQGPDAPIAGADGALRAICLPLTRVGRKALVTPNPKLKLLDQVREVMRLKPYSIRITGDFIRMVDFGTERAGQPGLEDAIPLGLNWRQLPDQRLKSHQPWAIAKCPSG